jgi:hypothetical protein
VKINAEGLYGKRKMSLQATSGFASQKNFGVEKKGVPIERMPRIFEFGIEKAPSQE